METPRDGGSLDLGTRLILEALRLYRVPIERTSELRELRHDLDLLPGLRDQIAELLRCVPADQHIEYDVQGLRDQGTDIVVRLTTDGRVSYICLQVKSHKEIDESDLVAKLRTQHSESVDHYGPSAWWCAAIAADVSVKDNKVTSRLRGVRQAFAKKPRTIVIEPTNLWGFLQLTHTQMTSLVTLTLRSDDDPVLADSRTDLSRHPLRSAVLLELVAGSLADRNRPLTLQTLTQSPWLQAVSARTPWNPAFDGPAVAEPSLDDDSPQHFVSDPASDDSSSEPSWFDVDMWAPPPQVLRWLFHPQPLQDPLGAAERLAWRLPQTLDSLIASDDVELLRGDTIGIAPGAHPALFAIASEAIVRYGLSTEDLREHLVEVLFPIASDR